VTGRLPSPWVTGTLRAAGASRRELEGYVDTAKARGAAGLVWVALTGDGLRSPLERFMSDDERRELPKVAGAAEGDLVLLVADARRERAQKVLGGLRTRLAQERGMVPQLERSDPDAWRFAWITDFPWFEYNEDERRWDAIHHPFTGVVEDTLHHVESDPGKVLSKAYDITLNGWELASGSIRIHDRALQERMFRALGISPSEAQARFGFLLDAFRYGPPPHGGIAPGIDRIVALAAGESNIREVIAFPKTQSGGDPMTDAPAAYDPAALDEVGLRPAPPPVSAD
jgi:aspartyl-tRNA synthetase